MSFKTRLCLPAAPFRNQSGNQQITMSVGMCPLSNQLIPLPLNDDTYVYLGHGVSVSDSEVLFVSVLSGFFGKKRVVWLKMCRKKRHKSPFLLPKKSGNSQLPAFQYPYVIHQLIIIQHPWELIHFKLQGTRLRLRWHDRSNSSGMYIGLKSGLNWGHVLNWGQQTFIH